MKRLLLISLLCGILISTFALAHDGEEAAVTDTQEVKSICPVSKISDNARCMDCHTVYMNNGKPKFGLKEISPHACYKYPNQYFEFVDGPKGKEGYFKVGDIDANNFEEVFSYLKRYPEVKHLTVELHTPGGSIYQMWRIIALMDDFKATGRTISCIVRGFCASAGFVILNNATPGMRFVAPNAEIMWHEVLSIELVFGFKVSSPSDKEDEARILRHFQDNGNSFLASKGKMSKEEIDDRIRKKEWWMTGAEAVKLGFADGLIK